MSQNPTVAPTDTEKMWALICHLCAMCSISIVTIVVPLIAISLHPDSEFVSKHAKESLNFHISLFIWTIIFAILTMVVIGIFGLIFLAVACIVFPIIGMVKAWKGKDYRYPLIFRIIK